MSEKKDKVVAKLKKHKTGQVHAVIHKNGELVHNAVMLDMEQARLVCTEHGATNIEVQKGEK